MSRFITISCPSGDLSALTVAAVVFSELKRRRHIDLQRFSGRLGMG